MKKNLNRLLAALLALVLTLGAVPAFALEPEDPVEQPDVLSEENAEEEEEEVVSEERSDRFYCGEISADLDKQSHIEVGDILLPGAILTDLQRYDYTSTVKVEGTDISITDVNSVTVGSDELPMKDGTDELELISIDSSSPKTGRVFTFKYITTAKKVSVNKSNLELYVEETTPGTYENGQTFQLSTLLTPTPTYDKVRYIIDSSQAGYTSGAFTVSDTGLVTALKPGTAKIRITAVNAESPITTWNDRTDNSRDDVIAEVVVSVSVKHDLEYWTEGASIIGRCTATDCNIHTESDLTLSLPGLKVDEVEYTGKPIEAKLNDYNDYFFGRSSSSIDVTYYSLDSEAHEFFPLEAAPADLGSYMVTLAFDYNTNDNEDPLTVSLFYEIVKAPVRFDPETPASKTDLVYNGEAQELVTGAKLIGGEFWYKMDGYDSNTRAVPTGKDAGDYTVRLLITPDENHFGATYDDIHITIKKADLKYTDATFNPTDIVYDGRSHKLINSLPDGVESAKYYQSVDEDIDFNISDVPDDEWSSTVPSATDAGAYTVYVKMTGDKNHNDAIAKVNAVIRQRPATLVWEADSYDYTGRPIVPVATVSNLAGKDKVTVTVSAKAKKDSTENDCIDIGSYTATATDLSNPNYILPAGEPHAFKIVPVGMAQHVPASVTNLVYNGEEQDLVTCAPIEDGKVEYYVDGSKQGSEEIPTGIDAGTYEIHYIVTPDNNHLNPIEGDLTVVIAKAEIPDLNGKGAVSKESTYDGKAHDLVEKVAAMPAKARDVQFSTTENGPYSTSVATETNAGEYTVYAKFISNDPNYKDTTVRLAARIKPLEAKLAWNEEDTFTYDGTAHAPTATVTNLVENGPCTVTVTGEKTDAGADYVATISALSSTNYVLPEQFERVKTFTIEPKVAEIAWDTSKLEVYNGKSQAPVASITNTTETTPCTPVVTVNDADHINAGEYTATVTGLSNSNYVLPEDSTVYCNYTIEKKVAALAWDTSKLVPYNGKSQAPVVTVTNTTAETPCTPVMTVNDAKHVNAGKYTAKVTGLSNSNYELPKDNLSCDYVIDKAKQKAPAAPVVTKVTINGVAVQPVDGVEFSVNGGKTWQSGNVFKKLTMNKVYNVIARRAESQNYYASPASAASRARTLNASQVLTVGLKVQAVGSRINVYWHAVAGAAKYEVYAQYCNNSYNAKPTATTTKTAIALKTINGKAINTNANYKVYVVAKDANGKILGKTVSLHGVPSGRQDEYTDAKSISVAKKSVALTVGKSFNTKAKLNLVNAKLPQLSDAHASALRFGTSDPGVATVNAKGVVTAKGKGVCYIYVYARTGLTQYIAVAVR